MTDTTRHIGFSADTGRAHLLTPRVTKPIGRPYFHRVSGRHPRAASGFTPPQLAKHYNFPTDVDGSGQIIALIELGGGHDSALLAPYWAQIGVKQPTILTETLPDASNSPGGDADGEVCLDICVAGGIAPGAKIAVCYGQNSDQDFVALIRFAVDVVKATVISISWGGPEDSWPATSQQAMRDAISYAKSKGVLVFVASGDNDSGDGESGKHVDFPASAPEAIGCGGTFVGNGREVVWNDGPGEGGGGGLSAYFETPAYQATFNGGPMRSVPDVAGCADPASGWIVSVNGDIQTIGGTSAVAPMWAGLTALLQQSLGRSITQEEIYAAYASFTDITQGNNGAFSAVPGFDQCTGLGVPDGQQLLAALSGKQPQPAPPGPVPAPSPTPAPIVPTLGQVLTIVDPQWQGMINDCGGHFYLRPMKADAQARKTATDAALKTLFGGA